MLSSFSALSPVNWVAVGSLGTIGLLILGLYRYKAGKLDSEQDREQRFRDLKGKAIKEGEFVTEVHTIEFRESTDTAYRLKRYALRPIDGTIYLTVIIHNVGIGEGLWDAVDILFEEQDFHVEYMDSQLIKKGTAVRFKLETADYDDLTMFFQSLGKTFGILQENGELAYRSR